MPIPFKLDYVIEKMLEKVPTSEQILLKGLAGLEFSRTEAFSMVSRIEEHKWYISERLGRDVGMRVAAVDYMENIFVPSGRSAPSAGSRAVRRFVMPANLSA
jgi:hypothetical protein